MQVYQDSVNGQFQFNTPPKRIVSLVPSITEWLIDTGAEVVGRTKFCIHPSAAVENIPVIGGTKNFRFSEIEELNPDLIIGNKEENYREGINQLKVKFPVWITDIQSFHDAIDCFDMIAQIIDLELKWATVKQALLEKHKSQKESKSGRVMYLIWKDPYMTVGPETYIDSSLREVGYVNVIRESRYPEITLQEIKSLKPDELLLSSEPFPFKMKDVEELASALPKTKIRLVNGEFYSWYGTRLLKLPDDQVTGVY